MGFAMARDFRTDARRLVFEKIPTPSFVVFESLLKKNLEVLKNLQDETGAKILLAQKCFSMFHFYPLIEKYLAGTASSGLHESLLAEEFMPDREKHVFSPAYKSTEIEQISEICDHVIFNSFEQVEKFSAVVHSKNHSVGLRLNPEHSTQNHAIYDPCNPKSRFGVRKSEFDRFLKTRPEIFEQIDGFHIHTLCEQNSDALEETLEVVEKHFLQSYKNIRWINLGGGHLITKNNYDLDRLKKILRDLKSRYDVQIYLEPGEAIALNAGFLISTVLEIQHEVAGFSNVILDTSAACHMPDVLEMPYQPEVWNASTDEVSEYAYRLSGGTCLAGDVIGEYFFDHELHENDRIVFADMANYTMVKMNTFNGINLPEIIAVDENFNVKILKTFGYENFKARL